MIGSTDEMTATASAMRPPRIMCGSVCRFTKLGPADVHAVRLRRAVAHDVAAELAARRLDRHVGLALGHLEALGEDLEVVDQRLHRLVDASARRRRDLLVLDPVVAARAWLVEDLADDPDRLADLVEADGVAVEAVAVAADDHVELDLVVVEVGHVAAQVPRHAGGAQDRAGGAEGDGLLGGDDADALEPLAVDRLAGEEHVVLVEAGRARSR